ncbi:MAG: flagellar motor switch phosphatase FliY [Lachnospiraceae bacterium]|nr:flagellar motor switch phosphatase FliY [Lachnospiraceae bacterium]
MDGSLTQEELDALLANIDIEQDSSEEENLTTEDVDAIGEIANICAGSSATNLSTVLNQRVDISTPEVVVTTKEELLSDINHPCIVVKINYIEGIYGCNIQILQENDVKVITDLMMGGDGTNLSVLGEEITEMHMSALCEAMNQMMGAAATSLHTLLNKKVDISPPTAAHMDLRDKEMCDRIFDVLEGGKFITVRFRLEIGDLIDSSLMQIYSIDFAKNLHELIVESNNDEYEQEQKAEPVTTVETKKETVSEVKPAPSGTNKTVQSESQQPQGGQAVQGMPSVGMANPPQNVQGYMMPAMEEVNILPAEFSVFDSNIKPLDQTEQINIIDDVSLEIAVELGKTQKSIREILDFEEGTLVELNTFTGEMMDILVNGKVIAKGEIVVLEDKFAVQLKEINVDDTHTKRRNSIMN